MKNRIKELRKALGLTQQKFADKIGVRQNTVAQYEMGRNEPIDTVINLICREFNVSEKWLRTGEGEMFINISKEAEIARFAGEILRNEDDNFKKRLVKALAKMNEEQWLFLENLAKELIEKD